MLFCSAHTPVVRLNPNGYAISVEKEFDIVWLQHAIGPFKFSTYQSLYLKTMLILWATSKQLEFNEAPPRRAHTRQDLLGNT